jgi:hypothetical protein
MKSPFKVGDIVTCVNKEVLPNNSVGPALELQDYPVKEIITTGDHDHLDVGIPSSCGSISCYESGITIPRGHQIHWCHPSRFKLKEHGN